MEQRSGGNRRFGKGNFGKKNFRGKKSFFKKRRFGEGGPGNEGGDNRRSFGDSRYSGKKDFRGKKPFFKKKRFGEGGAGNEGNDNRRSFGDSRYSGKKDFRGKKPFFKKKRFGEGGAGNEGNDNRRSFGDGRYSGKKDFRGKKPFFKKKRFGEGGSGDGSDRRGFFGKKSFGDKRSFRPNEGEGQERRFGNKRSYGKKNFGDKRSFHRDKDRSFGRKENSGNTDSGADKRFENKPLKRYEGKENFRKPFKKSFHKQEDQPAGNQQQGTELIRLNRYIANAGICSRREADELIRNGLISVNGKVITEMGFKVTAGDEVRYGGDLLKRERKVYVLLNKPKDYITTTEDELGRKNVLELVQSACEERIYPVGRLDRNTTGVLLFTNDGDLAKKLTHPKHGIRKIYHVTLDKNLAYEHLQQIASGIELEDGPIRADAIEYAGDGKNEVGVEIHSGRNRVIRRIFEHLGYEVIRLDRVMFAGLTKKNLERGRWRLLSEKEVGFLKMLG